MRKLTIVLAATVISLAAGVAVVGAAQAHWRSSGDQPQVTAEQARTIAEIRDRYSAELETLTARVRTAARDLDRAVAEGDTARAADLRQELDQAQKDLAAVRSRLVADAQAAGVAGPWTMMVGWNCPMMGGKTGMMGQGSGMMMGQGSGMMMGRQMTGQQGGATAPPCW